MNFFEHQRVARQKSFFLIMLFIAAIFSVLFIVDALLTYLDFSIDTIIKVLIAILTFILMTSWIKYQELSYIGGEKIAESLKACRLSNKPHTSNEKRLKNIVDELAIAASIPAPPIYIMKDEKSINSLVAGNAEHDAVIIVTQGALDQLNRDELQGVLAHEFSHLLNGDMKLNMLTISLMSGLTIISSTGLTIIADDLERNDNLASELFFLVGISLFFLGAIGFILSRIIKSLINNQREYLADACAVQYTRYSKGLIGALNKIAHSAEGSIIKSVNIENISHMFFSDGSFLSILSTHPPIITRIKKMDPSLSSVELEKLSQATVTTQKKRKLAYINESEKLNKMLEDGKMPDTSIYNQSNLPPPASIPCTDAPADAKTRFAMSIIESIGVVSSLKIQATKQRPFSRILHDAAHHDHSVIPLLLSFLYAKNLSIRQHQQQNLTQHYSSTIARSAAGFSIQVGKLDNTAKISLIQLSFATLRSHSTIETKKMLHTLQDLYQQNQQIEFMDFCFFKFIHTLVSDLLSPNHDAIAGNKKLINDPMTVSLLLTAMAALGSTDTKLATDAYQKGMQHALPTISSVYEPSAFQAEKYEAAFAALDTFDLASKQLLIEALVLATLHDQIMTPDESALLRIISACMHCPLPANVANLPSQ